MIRSIAPLSLVLLFAAACNAAGGRTSQAPSACPADSAASAAAMDTIDFWHVYLDGRRVLEAPSFTPSALTMAELRQARGICILYFTDAGAEAGARITALAAGADGPREIASETIGEGRGAEFPVATLIDRLEAADGLVFRIEFPDRPQGRWAEPHELMRIAAGE